MSLQFKKRFKNLSKALGIALFALLMFTNIKVALLDETEIASGDISILGVELTLFESTDAYGPFECKYIMMIHDDLNIPSCFIYGGSCCPDSDAY